MNAPENKTAAPQVSVVTATYNRSNVLRFAIESVQRQTFGDWELIVVGDACTDDTEQVVAEYAAKDARIRFYNLEHNIGEQSGPNNFGCQNARGELIAFLNHDDLWFSDHLEICTRAIRENDADLVHGLLVMVRRDEKIANAIYGIQKPRSKNPPADTPASSWVFRRTLFEHIGPWRFCRECCAAPSQDWLFRVWKAGRKIVSIPRFSVVAIPSGMRHNSYTERQSDEQQEYFANLKNEDEFRARELKAHGAASEAELIAARAKIRNAPLLKPLPTYPRRLARHTFYKIIRKTALLLGRSPLEMEMWVRHRGRKGGCIDDLRRIRGLPVLTDKKAN